MRRNFFCEPFIDARRLACLMTKIFLVRRRGLSLAADNGKTLAPVMGRTNRSGNEIGRRRKSFLFMLPRYGGAPCRCPGACGGFITHPHGEFAVPSFDGANQPKERLE